jgi:hypothetical protein
VREHGVNYLAFHSLRPVIRLIVFGRTNGVPDKVPRDASSQRRFLAQCTNAIMVVDHTEEVAYMDQAIPDSARDLALTLRKGRIPPAAIRIPSVQGFNTAADPMCRIETCYPEEVEAFSLNVASLLRHVTELELLHLRPPTEDFFASEVKSRDLLPPGSKRVETLFLEVVFRSFEDIRRATLWVSILPVDESPDKYQLIDSPPFSISGITGLGLSTAQRQSVG